MNLWRKIWRPYTPLVSETKQLEFKTIMTNALSVEETLAAVEYLQSRILTRVTSAKVSTDIESIRYVLRFQQKECVEKGSKQLGVFL